MRIEIIASRTRHPIIGEVFEFEESLAQRLVDNGLAKLTDKKVTKKVSKNTTTEGKEHDKEQKSKTKIKDS